MSNRNERNRLKRKGRIQKLLGEDYEVDSYYGYFRAYKRMSMDTGGVFIDFKPYGLNWHITSQALGLELEAPTLRAGVKRVHAHALLVMV